MCVDVCVCVCMCVDIRKETWTRNEPNDDVDGQTASTMMTVNKQHETKHVHRNRENRPHKQLTKTYFYGGIHTMIFPLFPALVSSHFIFKCVYLIRFGSGWANVLDALWIFGAYIELYSTQCIYRKQHTHSLTFVFVFIDSIGYIHAHARTHTLTRISHCLLFRVIHFSNELTKKFALVNNLLPWKK